MAESPTIAEQQAATLDVLTSYRSTWLDYRKRVERVASLDAGLNNEFRVVNDHMDFLLERYFGLNSGVVLELTPSRISEPLEVEYDGA